MSFVIEVCEPDREPVTVTLPEGSFDVGREGTALVLVDPGVSRRHLELVTEGGRLWVRDLGSANGTRVNGTLIAAATDLHPGDRLALSDTEIRVVGAEPRPQPDGDRSTQHMVGAPIDRFRLLARQSEAGVVRFHPGTPGADAAGAVLAALPRARQRLAGFGSEPSGLRPVVNLVDPFPDPGHPSQIVASGTVVDAAQGEIWMVVTAESPPEPLERPLALLFGAALPNADELGFVLEGFGLSLAEPPDPDPQLRGVTLPAVADAAGPLRSAMALSFARFLAGKADAAAVRRLLVESGPGQADALAAEVFGAGMAGLEEEWRAELASPGGRAGEGRKFLPLTAPLLRRHRAQCVEIAVSMVLGLAFTIAFPFAFKRLIDTAIPRRDFSSVLAILGVVAVAFVVTFLSDLRRAYVSAKVSAAVSRDLRQRMFDRLQTLSMAWLGRHQEGDVTSRFYADVAAVEMSLSSTLANGISQMAAISVSCVILLVLNFWLGLIVLAGAPLVLFVYTKMGAGAERRSLVVGERTGSLVSLSAENYNAQALVKVFGLERREQERYARVSDKLVQAQVRLELFGGLFGLSVNVVVTALRVVVLAFGAWLVIHHHFSIGGLVAFLGVMSGVLGPITILTEIGRQLQAATGSLVRIKELLDATPDIADAPGAADLPRLTEAIQFQRVGFSYHSDRRTLDAFDVEIPAGSKVAFVGPTGAGKSSVLRLVMRLYDPDQGAVLFDGQDIRTATLASLRGQLGVVFQDTFLFDASIRENIALGRPGATDAEVEAAGRAAELHEFISSLPRGYDTPVGERGSRLSGGQRQRLAIARALIREPPVLLLDEATSALDPRTERLIGDTLDRAGQGRTTIAVTHRLTSITHYDRIFVVVDGRLAESGTHAELVGQGGVYADLWAEQTGGEVAAPGPGLGTGAFDATAALARLPLFSALPAADLAQVAARLQPLELAAGSSLADGDGRLYIVRRGSPTVFAPGIGTHMEAGPRLGPGDSFGLSALLEGHAGLRLGAESAVSLLVLDDSALASLARRLPIVAAAFDAAGAAVGPLSGQRLSRVTLAGPLASGG